MLRQKMHLILGLEGELALAQRRSDPATAPNRTRGQYGVQSCDADGERRRLMPPKTILNAPTKLMASEGYGDAISLSR